jgi:hypothetical protein
VAHACNLAPQEEIRRITVQSQTGQIVPQDHISEKPFTKSRAGGVAQGEGPEFKPQYKKKKRKCMKNNYKPVTGHTS